MPANPTPAEGVVVPLEPMPEMLAAFWRQKNTGSQVPGETGDDRSDYAAYRAMLAARPAAPTQSAAQTGEVFDELADDLYRRADACHDLMKPGLSTRDAMRLHGKEAAYRHAAHLVRAALSQPEPSQ